MKEYDIFKTSKNTIYIFIVKKVYQSYVIASKYKKNKNYTLEKIQDNVQVRNHCIYAIL